MTLSIILLIIAILLYLQIGFKTPYKILFSILIFINILIAVLYLAADYFTGSGIDDTVIGFVKFGFIGSGFSEYWLLITIGIGCILAVLFLSYTLFKNVGENKKEKRHYKVIVFLIMILAILLNPGTKGVKNYILNSYFASSFTHAEWVDFKSYYQEPYIKEVSSDHKNIVYIYAESLERTYFDEKLFPGLIKGLKELESDSVSFTEIGKLKSTSATISGTIASQCGIPLITPTNGINSFSGLNSFLPLAVCLGDLLHSQDYYLSYHGGAYSEFAGKGNFYSTHKFDEILGRKELLPKTENKKYKTGWGLYDDSLFEIVYKRFETLSETKEKFALFTLTLDTHGPTGNPSLSCSDVKYKDGSNKILNAVACSDLLITDFVNKIRASEYAENTIIVVASDHLVIKNTVTRTLRKGDRKNMFMIIDPSAKPKKVSTPGTTLDIAPTLLPYLGYEGEIGLGRDLNNSTLSRLDPETIEQKIIEWKAILQSFHAFPRIAENIEIKDNGKYIVINNKTFKAPILIEFDDNLNSILSFNQGGQRVNINSPYKIIKNLDNEKRFLFLNTCKSLKIAGESLEYDGMCVVIGKNNQTDYQLKVDENIFFSPKDLLEPEKINL